MSDNGSWYVISNAERRRGAPGRSTDSGYVEGWGLPVWRDERSSRQTYGLAVDPQTWNVRGTEVNNFDYAVVDPSMVSVDTDGYLHIKSEFLDTPAVTTLGGTATAAADDTITTTSNHGLAANDQVYINVTNGSGISSGYYYVKEVIDSNTITVSTTCGIWQSSANPGGAGAVYNITGSANLTLAKHRWMKTGYIDHRIINGGDIQPLTQQYGRWEMRAKVPTNSTNSRGALAAFWLRNSGTITVNGNAGGEIDIMESWGSGPTPKYRPDTGTLTFFKYTTVPNGGTQWKYVSNYEPTSSAPLYQDFHVWTFERTATYIAAYKDGVRTFYATPSSMPQLWGSTFTNPFHLRINLHMGPSAVYWGLPDPTQPGWTATPLDYQLDYVRVWSV